MSDHLLLLAPLVVPLGGAGVAALAWRHRGVQRLVSGAALLATVAAGVVLAGRTLVAGVVHTTTGVESPLHGVALTAAPFGAALVVATGLLVAVVLATMVGRDADEDPRVHPLVLVLVGAASGSFVAGDLFNLFVLFELVLVASYALLARRGDRRQLRGAVVYIGVNLVGTLLLLAGIAAVYGSTGTVNLAQLAERPGTGSAVLPGAALVVTAFALKAGLLPFSGWLVVGYPAAPRTTMALFSGTLTTVGVAALYRVLLLAFHGTPQLRAAVLVAAVATAVLAALAATAIDDAGRVLALLVTAQVGFMALGVGIGTTAAVTAGIFFVLQDVVVKAALVLGHDSLAGQRGRAAVATRGLVGGTFVVLAFSLVGLPPLAGFLGKALLVEAALQARSVTAAVGALVASFAILAALVALWRRSVQDPTDSGVEDAARASGSAAVLPAAAVAVAAVAVGVAPGWLVELAEAGSQSLLDPAGYAREVLGP